MTCKRLLTKDVDMRGAFGKTTPGSKRIGGLAGTQFLTNQITESGLIEDFGKHCCSLLSGWNILTQREHLCRYIWMAPTASQQFA